MALSVILLMIVLAGGLLFCGIMAIIRRLFYKEAFSLDKFVRTFGFIAIIGLIVYFGIGFFPTVETAISDFLGAYSDGATILAALSAIVTGGIYKILKAISTSATTLAVTSKTSAAKSTTETVTVIEPAVATTAVKTYGKAKVLGIYGGSAKGDTPKPVVTFDVNMVPEMFFDVSVVEPGVAAMQLIIDNVIQKKWNPDMEGKEPEVTVKFPVAPAQLPYSFKVLSTYLTPGDHSVAIRLGYFDYNGQNPTWVSLDTFKMTFTGTKFVSSGD